jgi:hypothetical protein
MGSQSAAELCRHLVSFLSEDNEILNMSQKCSLSHPTAVFFASGMTTFPLNARIHSDREDRYQSSALDLC